MQKELIKRDIFELVSAAALSVEFAVGAIYKQSAGAAAAVQNLLCSDVTLLLNDEKMLNHILCTQFPQNSET